MTAQQLPGTSRRRLKGVKRQGLARLHFGRELHFDRGAAAVEMALVLPVLLFLFMGMIDFGRGFNAQIQVSQAAREGVRLAALNSGTTFGAQQSDTSYGDSAIATRVSSAAGGISAFTAYSASCPTPTSTVPSVACITYCPTTVGPSSTATVVLKSNFTWITGISAMSKFFGTGTFPSPSTVQATGVMRCAG